MCRPQEIFTLDELSGKFSLERITKSPAVFDKVKLSWMNGQHLRALPEEQLLPMIAQRWAAAGALCDPVLVTGVTAARNSDAMAM